jgi:AcrR family transcriptional regulator
VSPRTTGRTIRETQALASRLVLLDSARTEFARRGYAATTVAAILDRAGMARGALYHYFPGGKREIFEAVFGAVNEEFHRVRDAAAVETTPFERVRAAIHAFLALCRTDEFTRIVLADAPWVVHGQGGRGSSYHLLREQLAEARDAGQLAAPDVDAAAMALYGAVRAAGEFVAAEPGLPERTVAAGIAADTLDLLLDGLAVAQR